MQLRRSNYNINNSYQERIQQTGFTNQRFTANPAWSRSSQYHACHPVVCTAWQCVHTFYFRFRVMTNNLKSNHKKPNSEFRVIQFWLSCSCTCILKLNFLYTLLCMPSGSRSLSLRPDTALVTQRMAPFWPHGGWPGTRSSGYQPSWQNLSTQPTPLCVPFFFVSVHN